MRGLSLFPARVRAQSLRKAAHSKVRRIAPFCTRLAPRNILLSGGHSKETRSRPIPALASKLHRADSAEFTHHPSREDQMPADELAPLRCHSTGLNAS